MSPQRPEKECPFCAEWIAESAVKCRYCGEIVDEEAAGEMGITRSRRRGGGDDAAQFLLPTRDVSVWSLVACYSALLGCIPLVGALFGLLALICGIIAIRRRKRGGERTYGAITGDIRAIIGIVLGSLTFIGWTIPFVIWMFE